MYLRPRHSAARFLLEAVVLENKTGRRWRHIEALVSISDGVAVAGPSGIATEQTLHNPYVILAATLDLSRTSAQRAGRVRSFAATATGLGGTIWLSRDDIVPTIVETSEAPERFMRLEPTHERGKERVAHALGEHEDVGFETSSASDQMVEPYIASLVRLDASDAEEVFRKALN